MEMTFRWYGSQMDPIPLRYIKQIPNMSGVVSSLMDIPAGEPWPAERIRALKEEANDAGLALEVIESVNVHEDIKLGLPSRDEYIENYRRTVALLGQAGVKVICYNFMPVFDWTRTDLFKPRADGATILAYDQSVVDRITDPQAFADQIQQGAGKFEMAGWEPERMAKLDELFEAYRPVTKEKLWENLQYFLEAIMPTCHETGIKMAIHQDDPPWDIFGIPRLLCDKESIGRFLHMVDDEYNCLCLCSGSLGANMENNVADIIRTYCDRIAFAHIRNLRHYSNGDFSEVSHRDCDGDTGILEIMRAYHDCGYTGYVRPDHGRHLWGEEAHCRPGYGLYDRALGIMYLWGCWDMLERLDRKI